MTITALPTPPSRSDPANFATRADAFHSALPTFAIEANALQADVNAKQTAAAASAASAQLANEQAVNNVTAQLTQATTQASLAATHASTALTHASSAAANTNAPLWVSGTTYAVGALVYSPVNARTYRRIVAGAGTTTPSSDATNWLPTSLDVATGYPSTRPSLNLDFANSATVDPRITFTRASTASYYDGKTTAKAEQNLLLYSQEFDNATWAKNTASITANTTAAPDGTTTADTLVADGTTGQHFVKYVISASTGAQTYSVYVKANTNNFIQLLTDDVNVYANFDLSTGVAGNVGTACTSTIASVGSSWYRCTVSIPTSASGNLFILLCSSNTSSRYESNSLATSVYIWGAQLEQRSTVTAYTPTTTAPITNYIPVLQTAASGVPRLDYDPVTFEAKGLLIEEQRTNLLTYSEEFDNAAWTKTNAAITANTVVAPDGTLTADKFIPNSGLIGDLNRNIAYIAGTIYSVSLFFKVDGLDQIKLVLGFGWTGTAADRTLTVSLVNKSVVSAGNRWVSGSVFFVDYGNGWYRLQATTTSATTTTTSYISLQSAALGDGYSGIYIWGAQLEAGSFATSYIPTTSAQVTRAADSASMTGTNFSSWYSVGGTLTVQASTMNTSAERVAVNISNGSSGTRAYELAFLSTGNRGLVVNSSVQASLNQAPVSASAKYAMVSKANDFALSVNGNAVLTGTAGTVPAVSAMWIGSSINAAAWLNGHVQKIAFYPNRLANTELQALTA